MNTQIHIKSVYLHYDETFKVYNMFIFVTYCTVGFCIHRIADDVNKFYYRHQPMYHSFTYIYEKVEDMSSSIYRLKQTLCVKKKKIHKELPNYIECFTCFSCNYFVYILSLAFDECPDNIVKYGIYYDYETYATKHDTYLTKLSDCLIQSMIITNETDLSDKVVMFIQSGYNTNVCYASDDNKLKSQAERCNKISENETRLWLNEVCSSYRQR